MFMKLAQADMIHNYEKHLTNIVLNCFEKVLSGIDPKNFKNSLDKSSKELDMLLPYIANLYTSLSSAINPTEWEKFANEPIAQLNWLKNKLTYINEKLKSQGVTAVSMDGWLEEVKKSMTLVHGTHAATAKDLFQEVSKFRSESVNTVWKNFINSSPSAERYKQVLKVLEAMPSTYDTKGTGMGYDSRHSSPSSSSSSSTPSSQSSSVKPSTPSSEKEPSVFSRTPQSAKAP